MTGKMRKRLLAVLLTVLLLAALIPSAYAKKEAVGKLIYVVYDDSGSMSGSSKSWCLAKYAMEVFGAMLGEEDQLVIYPLSLRGKPLLSVQGSDPNRVAAIHDCNPNGNGGTPFKAVRVAGEDLLAAPEDYEKWLIILTDGGFNEDLYTLNEVQTTLDGYNDLGIKTIFLFIDTPAYVQENAGKGGWVLSASEGLDILKKITAAANQIFQHQVLPESHIKQSGKKVTLDVDVSTTELIVFAQGKKVNIGSMTLNGNPIQPVSTENVKYSDVKPHSGAKVDDSLKGVLVIYKGNFNAGEFNLMISGASTVEYYYRPNVMVNCELRYKGETVMMGDELYAGDYEATMNFVEPGTRNPVNSELMDQVDFTLEVENNGQTTTLHTSPGPVSLAEGQVTLTVTAELPGNVILTDSKQYKVLPEPVELTLTFETDQPLYTITELREGQAEYRMRATRRDGTPLTAEEAAQAAIKIQDGSGIHWDAVPGREPGTWILTPSIMEEDALTSGTLDFPTDISFAIGEQPFHGSGQLEMNFEPYVRAEMAIQITVPAEAGYELPDIRPPGIRIIRPVEVRLLDVDGQPLPPETAKGISLSYRCSNGVAWTLEPTQDPTLWTLVPERGLKLSLLGQNGNADLTIEAGGTVGDYLYQTTSSANVFFGPINFFWLMVYLAVLAGLLFLISGFLFRKKLNLRGLDPHCRQVMALGERITHGQSFRIIRKLTWWAPERAYVPCNDPDLHCDFPDLQIVATGGRLGGSRGFKILNWEEIEEKKVMINGNVITSDNKSDLENKAFSLTSFTISTIAGGDPDKVRGFFKFT